MSHDTSKYKRLSPNETKAIGNNLVKWQNEDGEWPKNIDWLSTLSIDSIRESLKPKHILSTIDIRNVWSQIEYLSNLYIKTNDEKYRLSAKKGIYYLLNTQNKSGGWRGWDVDAITFNDDVMTGVMNLFLDIKQEKDIYKWIDKDTYKKVCKSLKKAINVTLKCQIKVKGKKTAWCKQHDHKTLLPCKARTFELPSITANESSGILIFLMRIKKPNKKIRETIISGVQWLNDVRIKGLRIEKIKTDKSNIINKEYSYDIIEVEDSTAKPIWARYYEIETNKPFMCTRQGKKVYHLKDVNTERRVGYEWYGYWPEKVFKIFSNWEKENK